MEDAFELVDTRPVWDISLGSKPSTHHEVLGLSIPTISSLDMPFAFVRLELGFSDHGAERSALSNVEDSIAGVKVISKVVVVWIVVRPIVSEQGQSNITQDQQVARTPA